MLLQALVLFLLLTGGLAPCISAQVSPAQVPQQERALRIRVKEFYSFLQAGNWSQAEKYVTQDSLESFRYQTKTPFQGFEIDSIKLQPDGKSAAVVVRVKAMTPYSPTPFPLRRPSNWRLIDGVWYAEFPQSPRNAMQAMFQQVPPTDGASPQGSPPVELKFEHTETIVDPIQPGEVKEARFTFTNVSDHVVRLDEVVTGCECLRLQGEKKEYKPGESGTLVFKWNPAHYDYPYGLSDTITVKTKPGGAATFLTARTFVPPRVAGDGKSQHQK